MPAKSSKSGNQSASSGDPILGASSGKKRRHSVSSCNEYERCPRRYEYGYVMRLPQDRLVPTAWRYGSVVHAALEAAYKKVLRGMPLAQTKSLALDALSAAWVSEDMPDDAEWIARAEQVVADAIEKDPIGVAEILGVEQYFKSSMNAGLEFGGFADLVLRLDECTVEIVDHKVTSHASTPEDLQMNAQLNLYGFFALEKYSWADRVVVTHHYPPLRSTVSAELLPEKMNEVVASLVGLARQAEADTEFVPCPGEYCLSCPWADRCDAAPESARSAK